MRARDGWWTGLDRPAEPGARRISTNSHATVTGCIPPVDGVYKKLFGEAGFEMGCHGPWGRREKPFTEAQRWDRAAAPGSTIDRPGPTMTPRDPACPFLRGLAL